MRWLGLLVVVALTTVVLVVMTTRDETDEPWQPRCHAMPEYMCAQQHWEIPERTTP